MTKERGSSVSPSSSSEEDAAKPLFSEAPDGETQSWKKALLDEQLEAMHDAEPDEFDRQSPNHPKTTGLMRRETLEGTPPAQASRQETAAAARAVMEKSYAENAELRAAKDKQVQDAADQKMRDALGLPAADHESPAPADKEAA